MANVLIVYGSTTGNTASTATDIATTLRGGGHAVTLLDAAEAKAEGLCRGRDCVLFGCSTWGDADVELQDDFASLFEGFDHIEAKGCKTACFGCGDSSYTHFCGAVDAIAQRLEGLGAVNIAEKLKIDGDPGAASAEVGAWTKAVLAAL